MKNNSRILMGRNRDRVIATFGQARLVKMSNGGMELRGARAEERTAAKEWISLFMHEAVPRFAN